MVNQQDKPFTKTEMKIMVFNKVKQGMSYKQAVNEVRKILKICNKNHKKALEQKKKPVKFKDEFEKLTK